MSEEQGHLYYLALTDLKIDQLTSGRLLIDLEVVRISVVIVKQ